MGSFEDWSAKDDDRQPSQTTKRSFTDPCDRIQFVVRDFRVTQAEYQYLLERPLSADDVALENGESSVDAEDLPEPVRETILEALRDREHVCDEVPEGLASVLDDHDYVEYEDRYYRLKLSRINRDNSVRLQFDATLTDDRVTPDNPARIELTITNDTTEEIVIHDGPYPPFGVLRAVASSSGERFLLWSDGYAESPHLVDSGFTLEVVTKVAGFSNLAPGETIETEYQLRLETTGPFKSDAYNVDSNLTFSDTSEEGRKRPDGRLEYSLAFTVDRTSTT